MTTPAGWYDDGHGAQRWWDGAQWTEHVQTPAPDAAASAHAPIEQAQPTVSPDPGELPWELQQAPGAPGAAPLDPNGYPYGAYPGFAGAPGGGVFTGSTDPKKSKLWILWVVLGVVVIGIILLGIVLIPLLLHFFSGSAGGASTGTDAEGAAVAVVQQYDQAWDTADCAKYTAATTADFRESVDIVDCDAFTSASAAFTEQTDDYEITVDGVDVDGSDTILVSTTETYTAPFDENGEPTNDSTVYTETYIYTLVQSDGGWVIDGADDSQ
ncbi:DUF2510 domain-containing protein [Microbacterium sp. P01]|uniref:DUF2510 domain-containing protein n=1 Tax=Microbacterium sp. P01 TaxID=3366261 RepID=UPI00366DE1C5